MFENTWKKAMTVTIAARLVCLMLLTATASVYAQPVSLTLDNGLIAVAEYEQGDSDKPVLIFIHPFLQTGGFSTIKQLSEELSDSGYSVLLPTLTLGVSGRNETLPCEAIHTHTLDDGAEEIAAWVKWLEDGATDRAAARSIVLIGHSTGTLSVAKYIRQPASSVKKSILLSLPYFTDEKNSQTERMMIKKAEQLRSADDNHLETFSLAYCREYVATAKAYLSYREMNQAAVVALLGQAKTPVKVILGSDDVRIEKDWPQQVEKSGAGLSVIEGGTHFFNRGHEFDLVEEVESELQIP